MDNKILQGYLSDFKKDFNFSDTIKEDILFEHFCNYCILSKVHPEAFYNDNFKIEEINVGGGQDTGIDGIAIVVSKALDEFNLKRGKRNINDYKRLKDFTFEVIEQAKKLDPVYHKSKIKSNIT
jgi:hypothetical protein